jgi:predicted  nucleic acid-binding Zn-ribbon protein
MSCETGCREVQLIQIELVEVWKEIEKTKSDLTALHTESVRAEERYNALARSFANIQVTIDRMSERIDKQLTSIESDIKIISGKVQKNEARAEFTITWKEITAAGIGILALVNAIRPYIGG